MTTKTENVDYNLNDLDEFEIPGTNVVVPTVLTKTDDGLDDMLEEGDTKTKLDDVITKVDDILDKTSPSTRNDLIDFYKKKIISGSMVTFDDFEGNPDDKDYEDKLSKYLSSLPQNDLEELWDANLQYKEESVKQEIPKQFYESLPQELQYAAKYAADGGTDMKGLFKVLAQVQEVKELDPEKNPREVAYQYLLATNFGTDEEVQEQLDEWEDMNLLNKKASGFKPKLDKMQESLVEQKLIEQENQRKRNEQRAKEYVETVQKSLEKPDLGDIKLDTKTHNYILNGLLDFSYDSVSGSKTNLLGALIEKHQVVEPNYKLIAEAVYLLSDPEGYRNKLKTEGANKKVENITRQLKTEQNRRVAVTQQEDTKTNNFYRPSRVTNILKK